MDKATYDAYVHIIHAELIAAMGCTEPIAIAYCSAKAVRILGCLPEKIRVSCSGNIVKNVKGVVVPNSGGMKGIDVAAVLGAVGGDPDLGLEVIAGVSLKDQEKVVNLLTDKDYCRCEVMESGDNLHIAVSVQAGQHSAVVEIKGGHTRIVRVEKDGEILFTAGVPIPSETMAAEELPRLRELLSVEDILTFADTVWKG